MRFLFSQVWEDIWKLPATLCGEGQLQTLEDCGFGEEKCPDPIPRSPGVEAIGRARSSITPSSPLRWDVLGNDSIFSKLAQFLDREFSQELGKHSMFPLLQYVELIFLTKLLTHLSVTCLVVALC